ncbi:hypothetical protein ABZ517_05260 [Streptomyces scabiei]|uniref:hypothetical protein n=1 Tax=Streptomyces scabiei TaxID=1930 RepID=UPI00340EDB93
MSDFWLQKLREAGGAPAPAAPQAGLTPSGAPWWAHPTYGPPPSPAQPQPHVQAPQAAYQTTKAQSAKNTETCPSCGSDEYWRPTPKTHPICNSCHYPVQNSTQGVAIANNSSAPARASLFQAKGAGYQPNVIVGRL